MKQDERGIRIGELLVSRGVLSAAQVERVLEEQKRTARPFGDLAERMFGVSPRSVQQAWAEQYASFRAEVDLEAQPFDERVLAVLNRRQAWQFRVLPLRRDESDGELIAATSREHLLRAVNFAWWRLEEPVYFLIAPRPQLEDALMRHYHWPAAADLEPSEIS